MSRLMRDYAGDAGVWRILPAATEAQAIEATGQIAADGCPSGKSSWCGREFRTCSHATWQNAKSVLHYTGLNLPPKQDATRLGWLPFPAGVSEVKTC